MQQKDEFWVKNFLGLFPLTCSGNGNGLRSLNCSQMSLQSHALID